jgi:urease accessory protein
MPRAAQPMAVDAALPAGWEARLALRFAREPARTFLAERVHTGPLRVQKALYPEGPAVCQAIVVHPPGGIVGGDRLELDVDVGAAAHAQLTTPGAAKWYRSAGATAGQRTRFVVGAGGALEWLPQETLLFDGAQAAIATRIELAADASYIGWDLTCLGRTAAGERFDRGRFVQTLELVRAGELAWCERAAIDGGSRALQSGAVLGGAAVFGTLLAAGPPVADATLAACRAVACADGDGSVTRLPAVLVARYRGPSTLAARTYFATLWRVLRPALLGREAVPPRIWST